MLGSTIITNALYAIYGDTPAPASISTRAEKELYDIFMKTQRMKDWWFSRAEQEYSGVATDNEIDISALDITIAGIYSLTCRTATQAEYEVTQVPVGDIPVNVVSTGLPAIFGEDFIGYDDHTLKIFPTLDQSCTFRLTYRKIYAPATGYAGMAAYGSTAEYGEYILDILNQYLEAKLVERLCILLDYPDKVARYNAVAVEEMENLLNQNYDFFKSSQRFDYQGI